MFTGSVCVCNVLVGPVPVRRLPLHALDAVQSGRLRWNHSGFVPQLLLPRVHQDNQETGVWMGLQNSPWNALDVNMSKDTDTKFEMCFSAIHISDCFAGRKVGTHLDRGGESSEDPARRGSETHDKWRIKGIQERELMPFRLLRIQPCFVLVLFCLLVRKHNCNRIRRTLHFTPKNNKNCSCLCAPEPPD